MSTTSLASVLESLDSFPPGSGLCLAPESLGSLTPGTPCMVLDLEPLPPDEDVPEPARSAGYTEVLLITDVRSVRSNAVLQLSREPTVDELVVGVEFYIVNDAFFEF